MRELVNKGSKVYIIYTMRRVVEEKSWHNLLLLNTNQILCIIATMTFDGCAFLYQYPYAQILTADFQPEITGVRFPYFPYSTSNLLIFKISLLLLLISDFSSTHGISLAIKD